MRRRSRRRAGFTLIELVLAVTLGSIVMLGLSSIMMQLVREEVLVARGQTVQVNLATALKTADLEISQASWLREPALPGVPAGLLEGCQNSTPPSAGVPAASIDPSQPMRWFALCPAKGRLYYHTGGGCPPVYDCGVSPSSAFGGGTSSQALASFVRTSTTTTVVEISLSMASGGASENLQSAATFAGAAGTNQ